jgi:Uma2 family endonuclease
MAVVTTMRSGPFTRADLDAMPDDGRRYELVDGALLVTPAPGSRHQGMVVELIALLHSACPPNLRVFTAPYDVTLAEDTVVQPDVLVTRRADVQERGLFTAPALAVEVLSPSTRLVDLELKRARYEQAGVASYWVVDPVALTLTAWRMQDGGFVLVAEVGGDETFSTTEPFPVEVSPARLVG